MLNAIVAAALGFTLQWESDCQQRVQAARSLAQNDVGILVTTCPGWLPKSLYRVAYNLRLSQRPALAELYVHITKNGEVRIQDKQFSIGDAERRIKELRSEIIKVSGTENVHVMFVVDDDESGRKSEAYMQLSQFSYSEFGSGSAIKSSELDGRKKNLDPRNLMARGGE
ncbi:MAG: hypothetical protein JNM43_10280 [Planctomycetaceae bacterium]|nr:hypothetical protein [Planctomycetaceae bacterium]